MGRNNYYASSSIGLRLATFESAFAKAAEAHKYFLHGVPM